MYPYPISIPISLLCALGGAVVGALIAGTGWRRRLAGGVAVALALGVGSFLFSAGRTSLVVKPYGLMLALGILAGYGLFLLHIPQAGQTVWHVFDGTFGALLFGVAGARGAEVISHWDLYSPFTPAGFQISRLVRWAEFWDGGLAYFGVLAFLPWIFYYCRRHRFPIWAVMDCAGLSLALGQAIGRLGCFMAGCCYGKRCELPWAVCFPGANARNPKLSPIFASQVRLGQLAATAQSSLPVHPTQLYGSLSALLALLFLLAYRPYRKFDGQLLAYMLVMAGATRFFEECLRADEGPAWPLLSDSLTAWQFVALGLLLFGFSLLFTLPRRNALFKSYTNHSEITK